MIIANKVNINYEFDLFEITHDENKINNELEYLYFLALDDAIALFSNRDYSVEYLKHLEKIGFHIPAITRKATHLTNWWGSLKDRELEKQLNSKVTSLKVAQKLGISHPASKIIEEESILLQHLKQFSQMKWVLKDPHLFSGKGFRFFETDSASEIVIDQEYILEPWLNRKFDFGTIVYPDGSIKKHWNITDSSGAYKGTFVKENGPNFPFEYPDEAISKVVKAYRELGATSTFSIDSMVYLDGETLKVLPLVEVNYRRSLGYIAHQIRKRLQHKMGLIFLLPSKKHSHMKDHPSLYKLSPDDCYFSLYYLFADDEIEFENSFQEIIKTNNLNYSYLKEFLIDFQS